MIQLTGQALLVIAAAAAASTSQYACNAFLFVNNTAATLSCPALLLPVSPQGGGADRRGGGHGAAVGTAEFAGSTTHQGRSRQEAARGQEGVGGGA